MSFRRSAPILALAALAAAGCQKTASPCSQSAPPDRFDAADLLVDCLDTLNPTPVGRMPASGSAVYNGFATAQVDTSATATDVLFGDVAVTANFGGASPSIAGSITNMESAASGALGGTLTISAGTITGNNFGGTVAGVLTDPGQTITISGATAGQFFGKKAQMMAGVLSGTATFSGTGYVGTIDPVQSALIATK